MPIYEYRCGGCRRRVSIFFRSISSATEGATCPECGSPNLERLFSRVLVRRGGSTDRATSDDDMLDGLDDPYGDAGMGGFDDPFGDEDPDPREMARWAREMSREMGEPLDADLEQALTDLERGADPDEVMDRLDESPLPDVADDKVT
jgi:putative FmdB family regulatory protein